MCLIYAYDCASNITWSQGTVGSRIADVCFVYPWWMSLLPIVLAMIFLYVLIGWSYGQKCSSSFLTTMRLWGNDILGVIEEGEKMNAGKRKGMTLEQDGQNINEELFSELGYRIAEDREQYKILGKWFRNKTDLTEKAAAEEIFKEIEKRGCFVNIGSASEEFGIGIKWKNPDRMVSHWIEVAYDDWVELKKKFGIGSEKDGSERCVADTTDSSAVNPDTKSSRPSEKHDAEGKTR